MSRRKTTFTLTPFLIAIVLLAVLYVSSLDFRQFFDNGWEKVKDWAEERFGAPLRRVLEIVGAVVGGVTAGVGEALKVPVDAAHAAARKIQEEAAKRGLTISEGAGLAGGALFVVLFSALLSGLLPATKIIRIATLVLGIASGVSLAYDAFSPLIGGGEGEGAGNGSGDGSGAGSGGGSGASVPSPIANGGNVQAVKPAGPTPVVATGTSANRDESKMEPSQICAMRGGLEVVYVEKGDPQKAPYLGCRCLDGYFTAQGVFTKRQGYTAR